MIARLVLLAVVLVLPAGCIQVDEAGAIEVDVWVTRNAGTDVLQQLVVVLPGGATALEAIEAIAEVETQYGGRFVVAIDGLRSRHPAREVDWFYHVNGALQSQGAADRLLADGDVLVWDHRPWNRTFVLPHLLTGLAPEALPATHVVASVDALGSEDARFVRVQGEQLVVLDATGAPAVRVDPPWAVLHVTSALDEPLALGVLTSPDVAPDGLLDGWTPRGVGRVLSANGTWELPA